VRIYLGRHHYRQSWAHSLEELADADRLAGTLRAAVTAPGGTGQVLEATEAESAFRGAMADDLDTPSALTHVERLADRILDAARAGRRVEPAQASLRRLSSVFGLRLDRKEAEERVLRGWDVHLERFSVPGPAAAR